MAMFPKYAMDRVRSTISATVVLSVLGVGLVGCTSAKDDPPACDPSQRQQRGMASLSPTEGGCPPLVRPTYNSDH
jgi:hypothetical protein